MKKKYFGSDDIISVYKFMERCGLHCKVNGNIYISHEIMMHKLKTRKLKFPNLIIVPDVVPFKRIITEDVKTGKTILVKDDYRKIKAYSIPTNMIIENLSSEEREQRRLKCIKEAEEQIEESTLKPGYVKYLERKKNLKNRRGE